MGQGSAEFVAVALPTGMTALAVYVVFCMCRSRYSEFYEPRTKKVMRELERPSEEMPTGCLRWLAPLLSLTLEDLAVNGGVEAAARIVFQGTMAAIFFVLTVFSCIVLLPTFATADGGFSGFDRLTMSNLPTESHWRHWVVAVACWPAAAVVYLLVYRALVRVVALKIAEEKRLCSIQHQVVVTKAIPRGSRSVGAVKSYFEGRNPGSVLYVQPIKDLGCVHEKLAAQYEASWRKWRRAEAQQRERPSEKLTIKDGFLGLAGETLDAVAYHRDRCAEYREQLRHSASNFDSIEAWSSAFVAFNCLRAASDALARHQRFGQAWGCWPAPHPREVYWPNMCKGRPDAVQSARVVLAGFLVAVIILAFAPLVCFAQSLVNLRELSKDVAFLAWVQDLPASVLGILQGLLPVLVVLVINALVIPVMESLAAFSGVEDFKAYHRQVMWYFFSHLVFNSFVIIVASGSLLNALQDVVSDPTRVSELLGKSLPKVSTFFILYLMTEALAGAPGKLALLPKLILSRIKLRWLVKTEYEREEAMEPTFEEFKLGVSYASDLFVCVVCLSYAMMAPLATVFGLLYFLLNVVTSKYLLNFYWKTSFNSGGMLIVSAFRAVCIGVMIGQLVVACCLALQGSRAAALLAPLAVVSFLLALLLPDYGAGYVARRQDLAPELILAFEEEGAFSDARRRLADAQAASYWAQPSRSPNFDDPVHDRFNWG